MKRRLLITVLGFGTIFGFSTGFASMSRNWHQHAERRQANFEAHVADVCVEAAERRQPVDDGHRADDAPYDRPPPRHHRGHRRGGW